MTFLKTLYWVSLKTKSTYLYNLLAPSFLILIKDTTKIITKQICITKTFLYLWYMETDKEKTTQQKDFAIFKAKIKEVGLSHEQYYPIIYAALDLQLATWNRGFEAHNVLTQEFINDLKG